LIREIFQKDKIILFKEFSYLLKWGVSLNEASNILIQSTDNFALRDMVKTIQSYLKKGMPLSFAIGRLPDYFNEGDIAVIKTGEASGKLPIVLAALATEYEYTNDIKNKYVGAMIYPVILLLVAIVAVISLFSLVLPSIFSIADSFENIQLPRATQMLRNISLFLENNRKELLRTIWWIGIIGGFLLSTDKGRKFWFSLLLQIPLIGKMTQYYYVVKFCRYMKLMNSSGMSYIETFQLLKDILGIPAYQDMLENIILWLKEGKDIYSSIKHERDLLPADVAVMIKVWEQTANLNQSLENVLTMYESELNVSINRLSKIIEPIMLIWIGWIVIVIAYAVFGLILQIMEWSGL
jgi:type II secretory pathway component PulF